MMKDLIDKMLKTKKGREALKEVVDKSDIADLNGDCYIEIKRENGYVLTNIVGCPMTLLIVLDRTMKHIQKNINLSDDELKEFLEHTTVIESEVKNND